MAFPHCVFANVSLQRLNKMKQNHIDCIFFYFSSLCICKCLLKLPTWKDAKPHWLHLFDYFSTMHFQMCFQSAFIRVCIGLSPLCVFKCLLKSFACKDASHIGCICSYFSPVCVFKCVFKSLAWEDAY